MRGGLAAVLLLSVVTVPVFPDTGRRWSWERTTGEIRFHHEADDILRLYGKTVRIPAGTSLFRHSRGKAEVYFHAARRFCVFKIGDMHVTALVDGNRYFFLEENEAKPDGFTPTGPYTVHWTADDLLLRRPGRDAAGKQVFFSSGVHEDSEMIVDYSWISATGRDSFRDAARQGAPGLCYVRYDKRRRTLTVHAGGRSRVMTP